MYIVFSIIFILSLAGGAAWSYINNLTVFGTLICLTVAGFIGSSVIALIFSYLYFYQKETDKEKIRRLQEEINELKEIKRIEQ
ncbi:MAG: hypothetical protein MI863_28850 [Desulfobacterales bacterium]|nr:hypothetical protein [Desulfobacterales bacterium]